MATSTFIYLPSLQSGGGGGTGNILSINGDTTAAQFIVGGTDIIVGTSGGITTIDYTGSGGGVTSVNGQTGVVVLNTDDIAEGATNLYLDYANLTTTIAAGNNAFLFTGNAGEVVSLGGWNYDPTLLSANVNLTVSPAGAGGGNLHNWVYNLDPTANSPAVSYNVNNFLVNIDTANDGFSLGTGGFAAGIFNASFNLQGSSDLGSLSVFNSNSDIGNGTDSFFVSGYNGFNASLNVDANVQMRNQLQGFFTQANFNAATTIDSSFYVNAYSDNNNLPITLGSNNGYTSFASNPIIGTSSASQFLSSLNANPQVTTHNGNWVIANIGGTAAGGTGSWQGISVNTTQVDSTGQTTGINVNVKDFTHTAIQADGRVDAFTNYTAVSSAGQITANSIGGSITIPDATTITGTTAIFNTLAVTVDTGDATSVYTGDGLVDLSTVGFAGQIIGDGNITTGINFLLAGYQNASTGTINRINNVFAAGIPAGAGTVNEAVLFFGDMPFGLVGTDNWGVRIEASGLENYMPKLAVGDMASKKVANASVGIELDSTTKAVLISRMTTTQRNALTAVNGMQIYNTTTTQNEYYENGSWVAHGGGGGSFMATTSVSSISANTTLSNNVLYFVDTTGGPLNLTLPAPSTSLYIIVKDSGGAFNTDNITLVRPGTEEIEGVAADYVYEVTRGSLTIVSDGTNYFLVHKSTGWGA